MRIVWLLGGDAQAKLKLEKALAAKSPATQFHVRLAPAVNDINVDDMLNPGTIIICDAFHPTYPAFEGVKSIRAAGFTGALFLAGEPSPELSVLPFRQHKLTGYFPSFDRADFSFVAGLIHNQLFFEGEMDLTKFLAGGGRASTEVISSFKDFNVFGAKLATFVQKFGIDIAQVRKLLMGLGLPHIKSSASGPAVEKPFSIFYGIDQLKLVVGVSSYSRGANLDSMTDEFTQMLAGLKDQKALPGTIFPELYHVARAANNLILVCGSAKQEVKNLDPLFLLSVMPFPKVGDKSQGPVNLFSLLYAVPSSEASVNEENQASAAVAVPAPGSAAAVPTPETLANGGLDAPAGMIQSQDLDSILDEPKIVGDKPRMVDGTMATAKVVGAGAKAPNQTHLKAVPKSDSKYPSSAERAAAASAAKSNVSAAALSAAEAEITRLKEVCTAMGQDIRRLMKERRVPSTDRELRDAVTQIEEKYKKAAQEKVRLQKSLDDKSAEATELKANIETLKLQLETLKKSKAA